MIPVSVYINDDAKSGPLVTLDSSLEYRSELYLVVRKWPGWSQAKQANRGECRFTARPNPSALLPLGQTRLLEFRWGHKSESAAYGLLKRTVQKLLNKERALARTRPELSGQFTLPTERTPHLHQWNAIEAARALDYRVLLADDMGLGKTSEALWVCKDAAVQHMLIISPVSVKWNWQREIWATLGAAWDAYVIHGTKPQRATQFSEIAERQARQESSVVSERLLQAVIINYDLLIHLTERQLKQLEEFVRGQALICDESHYVKSRKSKRFKLVYKHFCSPSESAPGNQASPTAGKVLPKNLTVPGAVSNGEHPAGSAKAFSSLSISEQAEPAIYHGARVRLLLTGTPIRNLADDLYTQISMLRPGTWTSYSDFEKRYLRISEMSVGTKTIRRVVGTKNVSELNAIVNTVQIRRKKDILPGLPEKVFTYPEIELTDDAKRVYKAMKDYALLQIEELLGAEGNLNIFDARAKSAIDAAMRCEQIAQGFVGGVPDVVRERVSKAFANGAMAIKGRPNEVVFPRSPKIVFVMEAITSVVKQGGNPIVFSRFNAPMFWLREQWKQYGVESEETCVLHGGLSGRKKDDLIENFQSGGVRILFIQVKMAEGFNLTRSQDVIFLGRSWSPAVNAQATGRAHRMGQTGTVNVQIPIVRGTIEERIDKRLAAKDADAEQALKSVSLEDMKAML